jgi:putative transposase
MARLPRLVVPGYAHLVCQRGHNGGAVFVDAIDRGNYRAALNEAAAREGVQLHALALLDREVLLLVTPTQAASLGRFMQAVGRRYVSAYNRRHRHTGTLWDGRFRCGVIEPGPTRLDALRLVDGRSAEPGTTSAAHRTGEVRDASLTDPPEYWQLGNTPFERESAWRSMLTDDLPATRADTLLRAANGGWAAGSAAFGALVAAESGRPALPRPRGRPARTAG